LLKAREEKKIITVANPMVASAMYWLASQTSEIVVTPSGMAGWVGVIAAHTDETKAEEMRGEKTTLVYAGRYKAEGYQPLTEDGKAAMQDRVDKMYGMFVRAVAKGRGVSAAKVDSDFGQGRGLMAKDAVAAGMADRVATLEDTLRRLGADDAARAGRDRTAQMAALGLSIN
jgi:ClpP class serine protease